MSSIYTVYIEVTPSVSSSTYGGNFTISIHYDDTDPLQSADSSGLLDFTFMGLCQSVTPSTGSATALNSCSISDDLTEIYFSVNSFTLGQPIRIQTQVNNPLYVSNRGIRAYVVDFISGEVLDNGYEVSALVVDPININGLGDERLYLLWGISS